MSSYMTHTWSSVVSFYQKAAPNGVRVARMAELVARVAASPYAAALHPVTSHYMLRLFAHDTWDTSDDQIQVEHDGEAFEVRYVASGRPHNPQQAPVHSDWHRRDVDGYAALERCLDHLRWVPSVSAPASSAGG